MKKTVEEFPPAPDRKKFDAQLEVSDLMDLAKSQPNDKLVPSAEFQSLIHTNLLHSLENAKDCDASLVTCCITTQWRLTRI